MVGCDVRFDDLNYTQRLQPFSPPMGTASSATCSLPARYRKSSSARGSRDDHQRRAPRHRCHGHRGQPRDRAVPLGCGSLMRLFFLSCEEGAETSVYALRAIPPSLSRRERRIFLSTAKSSLPACDFQGSGEAQTGSTIVSLALCHISADPLCRRVSAVRFLGY